MIAIEATERSLFMAHKEIKIESIDHIVLTVRNIESTVHFYQSLFGMTHKEFKPGRHALYFGNQKINLHQVDKPVDKNVLHATPGSADICLLTKVPIAEMQTILKSKEIKIIQDRGKRSGARSEIESLYIYDPDENLIEIANEI